MTAHEILKLLPYSTPFLFVDDVTEVSEHGITGNFTFTKEEYFYQGHFKEFPITPGVILTETMAQIGLVCLGIYLLHDKVNTKELPKFALTSTEINFRAPVFPGETVTVISKKMYFRFNKLKCEVEMRNSENKLIANGTISGMIKAGG